MECAFDVEYISRAWAGRPGVPDFIFGPQRPAAAVSHVSGAVSD